MGKEYLKVGSKQATPYGGMAEPIYMQVPVKWSEKEKDIIDDPKSIGEVPQAIFDEMHSKDDTLMRVGTYNGYLVSCHHPVVHWQVVKALDGSELPRHLAGRFTSMRVLKDAIDSFRDGKFGVNAVPMGKKHCNFGE